MRETYVRAIAFKEAAQQQQIIVPLAMVAVAILAMWFGVQTGNGWAIAGSLVLLLLFIGTNLGQRLIDGFMKLLLGVVGLAIVVFVIGFVTLFILAATGNLH